MITSMHSDGELEEVPSATVATPSQSIGNEAGMRKGYGPRPDATSAADASSVSAIVLFFASRGASVDGTGVSGKRSGRIAKSKTAPRRLWGFLPRTKRGAVYAL